MTEFAIIYVIARGVVGDVDIMHQSVALVEKKRPKEGPSRYDTRVGALWVLLAFSWSGWTMLPKKI